jgi:UPF0176 protein
MSGKPFQILLYYCYAKVEDAEAYAKQHLKFCKEIGILGRIIVADEGLNGTVSGSPEQCKQYMDYVHADPRFAHTEFKIDDTDIQTFYKIHVRYKPEIVHLGVGRNKGWDVDPTVKTGKHVNGNEFLELKEQEDVVVLDVRSNYEHNVGKFKNALTLDIDNFRDFPDKIAELEHLKDKKVITYCTGGIKCEKASALLLEAGFKDVYQLHGGIINYSKETGGKDFDGVCYVFDGRVTVPVNSVNPTSISTCYICHTATSRMVNCANPECNTHVPICESCGEEMDGACSPACKTHPRKRPYNGTGFYVSTNPTL